jgi:hypothetical protein
MFTRMDGFYKVFFLIIVLTSVLCKADIYPDGGETIEAGKECHIKWDAKVFGSDNIVVSLWMINNSAHLIYISIYISTHVSPRTPARVSAHVPETYLSKTLLPSV